MDLVRQGKEYNEAANLTGFFNEDEEIREEMIYNRMAEHLEKRGVEFEKEALEAYIKGRLDEAEARRLEPLPDCARI